MLRRHELTDAEWEAIEPLLPGRKGDPGRTAADNRLFVNAAVFVARTGVPWRDLTLSGVEGPGRFGKRNSVWRRYDRWCAKGVWGRLGGVPGEPHLAELHPDSTTVRAQHSAAGPRRSPAEKKRTPRRGGWATKVHAAVNGAGRVVRLVLTPGQAGDAPQADRLPDGLRPASGVADAAYDSDAIRDRLRRDKVRACIKPDPTRKRKRRYDRERYEHRNVIERFFGAVKRFRRAATRYDKKAANVLGFVWLAAVLVGLR